MSKREMFANLIMWNLIMGIMAILIYWAGTLSGVGFIVDNVIPFFAGVWFVFALGSIGMFFREES
jgi:lipopolysaccharide export LptBFGC system permease protein LptF